MSKKLSTKGVSISGRPNKYWGYDPAPRDCQLVIYCGTLDRSGFRRYIKDLESMGIYYRHDWPKKEVVIAFKDAQMRKVHEDFLRLNALKEGKLLDKDLKGAEQYLLKQILNLQNL